MKDGKKPALRDYIAGAVLANSIAWLTLSVAVSFETQSMVLVQLLFLTYMLGAVMAGYLISRKAPENHLKVGVKTGLGSFVFHIYGFMGVIEVIVGGRVLLMWDHLWILAIFISGGFVGSFLYTKFSSGRKSKT